HLRADPGGAHPRRGAWLRRPARRPEAGSCRPPRPRRLLHHARHLFSQAPRPALTPFGIVGRAVLINLSQTALWRIFNCFSRFPNNWPITGKQTEKPRRFFGRPGPGVRGRGRPIGGRALPWGESRYGNGR